MFELDREQILQFLGSFLPPKGLDLEAVHVTEVGDLLESGVVSSRPLLDEVQHWLSVGEEPTYDQGLVGIFNQPDTFDDEHRERGLRLTEVEQAIRALLDSNG